MDYDKGRKLDPRYATTGAYIPSDEEICEIFQDKGFVESLERGVNDVINGRVTKFDKKSLDKLG